MPLDGDAAAVVFDRDRAVDVDRDADRRWRGRPSLRRSSCRRLRRRGGAGRGRVVSPMYMPGRSRTCSRSLRCSRSSDGVAVAARGGGELLRRIDRFRLSVMLSFDLVTPDFDDTDDRIHQDDTEDVDRYESRRSANPVSLIFSVISVSLWLNCVVLVDAADAEAEVADFGVGELRLAVAARICCFWKVSSCMIGRVGDGDFERAAAEAAGAGVAGERLAGGVLARRRRSRRRLGCGRSRGR